MKDLTDFLDSYEISYEIVGNTVVCEDVNLSYKNITTLPESIGLLRCRNLWLCNNQISILPDSFGDIIADFISVKVNKLTQLPESIGALRCDTLILSNNYLKSLPESFGKLVCNYISLKYTYIRDLELSKALNSIKCNYIRYKGSREPTSKFSDVEITKDYIYCDGTLTWYKSVKKINDEYTIYKGYFNNYVVQKDNVFAHGNSIRTCISDIQFKLSDRDCSIYESYTLDTELSLVDAVIMYRTITGACSAGVEKFIANNNVKNTNFTVRDIIEITKGAYGSIVFKNFFKHIYNYDVWISTKADEIDIELLENGANREMDFDPESEYLKRFEATDR